MTAAPSYYDHDFNIYDLCFIFRDRWEPRQQTTPCVLHQGAVLHKLAPLPGDPTSSKEQHVCERHAGVPQLTVVVQGIVSSLHTLENGDIEFLLTIQGYMQNSIRSSTIVSGSPPLDHPPVFLTAFPI